MCIYMNFLWTYDTGSSSYTDLWSWANPTLSRRKYTITKNPNLNIKECLILITHSQYFVLDVQIIKEKDNNWDHCENLNGISKKYTSISKLIKYI